MAIQIMGFSDLGKGVNLEAMPGIYDLTNASAPGNIGYVVSPLRGSTILIVVIFIRPTLCSQAQLCNSVSRHAIAPHRRYVTSALG